MKENKLPQLENISTETWNILAERKVFFAHMSVGDNILDGVKDVIADNDQIKITLVEVAQSGEIDRPMLAHAKLGHNTRPLAKIESFREWMKKIAPAKPDIALMKFCYVDIGDDTNVEALFKEYRNLADELHADYPDIILIHTTAPLCSSPVRIKRSMKEAVKALVGKAVTVNDNLKREQFNELLRKTYAGTEPLFDIADIESTTVDNNRCYIKHKGQDVPMMVKAYTNDSGHLNELGRRIVAEQFLITLVNIVSKQ
ncbi:MAG: SGNH/GDSL hydrolase family protein [Sedimentisphaerales bacterium]|nr:SGNH/GDSL hydrolase family protein [Sedimentisphaerales bacterium]